MVNNTRVLSVIALLAVLTISITPAHIIHEKHIIHVPLLVHYVHHHHRPIIKPFRHKIKKVHTKKFVHRYHTYWY